MAGETAHALPVDALQAMSAVAKSTATPAL